MRRLLDVIGLGSKPAEVVVPSERASDTQLGRVIAHRYRVATSLGPCGAGHRYLGHDDASDSDVMILLLPSSFASEQTLARLARLDVSFGDPRIVRPLGFGVDELGHPYSVTPAIEGELLSHELARGTMPWALVFDMLEELCDMLAAAHKRGLFHGCLEPSRVFVGKGGPWLVDFGLANALARSSKGGAALPGSPHYVAPELFEGRTPSARSDLYSLAIMLWEIVAGAPPFRGELAEIVEGHLHRPIPELVRRGDAPVEVEALLDIALSKQPADRFNDTNEMIEALRGIQASSSGMWSLSSLSAEISTPKAMLSPTTEVGAMLRSFSVVELRATRELIDRLLEARGAKAP